MKIAIKLRLPTNLVVNIMANEIAAPNAVDNSARITSDRSSLQQFRTEPTTSGLLPAEDLLLVAAVSGESCILGNGLRPDARDPSRCVRASFLRFLAMGGDDSVRVDDRGVVLAGAYVEDSYLLVGAHCKAALQFTDCFFINRIDLDYAHIPLMMLDGSRVPGIRGDLVQVEGGVFLQNGFVSTGPVRFYGARIAGNLDCRGATFEQDITSPTQDSGVLICSNAAIGGDLNLSKGTNHDFHARGQIRLTNAKIGGLLNADGAEFDNPDRTALVADSLSLGGSLSLREAKIAGHLQLRRASIGGELVISIVGGEPAEPVALELVDISGPDVWRGDSADALHYPQAAGSIVLSRRAIRPNARPEAPAGGFLGMRAQDIDVGGSLTLRGNFPGPINIDRGRIGGDLNCSGCLIDGRGSDALSCENAHINGMVFLGSMLPSLRDGKYILLVSDLFEARGRVNLASATIGRDLNCVGGRFGNERGTALDCSNSTINGSAYLAATFFNPRDGGAEAALDAPSGAAPSDCLGASFSGQVNFYGANISGDLNCSGSSFHAPGQLSLCCTATQIGGSVSLCRYVGRRIEGRRTALDVSDAFRSTGQVSLAGAAIGLNLNCIGGRFENEAGVTLDISNAKIKGSAILGCYFLEADDLAFRFTSQGTVGLYGTDIGGDLECTGGMFTNEGKLVVGGDGIQIGGTANFLQAVQNGRFGPRFNALGDVGLTAGKIGRYLQCAGGSFVNPGGTALMCSAIRIGGSVFLSKVDEPEGGAAGSTAQSQGLAVPAAKPAQFQSEGIVNFSFGQVQLVMLCQGGRFSNSAPDKQTPSQAALALDLRSARMDELVLGIARPGHVPAVIEGSIHLSDAQVRLFTDCGFVDDAGCFPATIQSLPGDRTLGCVMSLDGFIYDRLGEDSPSDITTRKAWLGRQPEQHLSQKTFRPQPFEQLVRVLRAMGQEHPARAIAIYKQQCKTGLQPVGARVLAVPLLVLIVGLAVFAERAASVVGWIAALACLLALYFTDNITWLSRTSLGLLVAYGYKPTRILLLALILGVGLSQVFRQAAEQGVFIPKTAPGELKPGGCGPDWTKCQAQPFVPIVYSFDTMLPLKLGQADKWSVERKPFQLRVAGREMAFPEWALQPLIWVEILFGWLTSGIILALVSGMLKKD